MQRHANQTISPRTGSSIPYGKPSRPSLIGRSIPVLFGTFGVALIAVAAVTALVPQLPAAFAPVLDGLTRAGLDKGPLAMFGLLTVGTAFGMRRPQPKEADDTQLEELLQREFQAMEAHVRDSGAAVATLRQDLAALQHSIGSGFEAAEAAASTSKEASNDRIFRLAASLDQLGAQVDRRLDAARQDLRSLITSSAESQRDATEQLIAQMIKDAQEPKGEEPHTDAEAAREPIYGGNPKEAMASFMDDLRSLPQDLMEDPAELNSMAEGELAMASDATNEPAAALPAPDPAGPGEGNDDRFRLIDEMEQNTAEPYPLRPGEGNVEGS